MGVSTAGLLVWILMLSFPGRVLAQHSHLNAGAVQPVAGSPLYFANGFNFLTESGYAVPLKAVTNGTFAGLYRGTITFTSLPATENYGGPAFGHAAPGAHLELQVESIRGPQGGAFVFWENENGEPGEAITFSVPVSETQGTNRFALSENDGSPDSDPYGHIHGRYFGATKPGLYEIGLRILNTSVNGPGGGALHPASELAAMYFQAGVTVADVSVQEGSATVRYAAFKGGTYHLETATSPEGPWAEVGSPTIGADHLVSVTTTAAETAYFRLRVDGL